MSNELTENKQVPVLNSTATNLMIDQANQLEIAFSFADKICQTDLVPKIFRKKPADAAVAIIWGAEIGLSPLQSLQNIAVINGTPALWGDALIALVKGSGLCEYLTTEFSGETTNLVCTCRTQRQGEPEEVRSFSWNDAVIAGLASRDTYKNYPKRMLQNRARSHLLRDVYADVLKGMKSREIEEEDQEILTEKNITPTVRPVKRSAISAALNKGKKKAKVEKVVDHIEAEVDQEETEIFKKYRADIQSCCDMSELNEVSGALSADKRLSNDELGLLRGIYSAHKSEIA